jgi:hypothetical protein
VLEARAASDWNGPQAVAGEGLRGLARSETTPLVMLVAVLALATTIMIGVAVQHPVAIPAAVAVAMWLGVVVRALVRRLRVPNDRRGAYANPGPSGKFARLLVVFEDRPVVAVIGFALVSGDAAFGLGARAVAHAPGGQMGFALLFAAVAAVGGGLVGMYQVRRARRRR